MAERAVARPKFINQLQTNWEAGKFVCVGLDAEVDKLPPHLKVDLRELDKLAHVRQEITTEFMSGIIDATAHTVVAFKPNIAFFEDAIGGEIALQRSVDYVHSKHSNVPVIGDIKRADIGNTLRKYADAAFGRYNFDAITTNCQYFGGDTLEVFDKYKDKGIILMSKTSNPGSRELQDMPIAYQDARNEGLLTAEEAEEIENVLEGKNPRVYEMVAFLAARRWNKNGNLGLVVGATYPEAFKTVRRLAGDLPLLIPGIGKQKGELELTLKYAPDSKGLGMIINSSSGIIFASSGRDFAEAAKSKALALDEQIRQFRAA